MMTSYFWNIKSVKGLISNGIFRLGYSLWNGFRKLTIDEIVETSFPLSIPFEIYYNLNFIKSYNTNYQLSDDDIEWDVYFLNHSSNFYKLKGFYSNEFEDIDKYMEDWKQSLDSMDSNDIINGIDDEYAIFPNYKNGQLVGYYKLKNPKLKEIK